MTTNELSKMMLIYEYLVLTVKPTKIVAKVKKQLRQGLDVIYKTRRDFYDTAREQEKSAYTLAWKNTFEGSEHAYFSMGTVIQVILNSMDNILIVSNNNMSKVLDSYYFAKVDGEDEYELEKQSNLIADEFVRLIDGTDSISPFKRRLNIAKGNWLLEGK